MMMKILMDFKWFFKVPGIFITGGVVLIIIALIVFLISSKKAEQKVAAQNAKDLNSQGDANTIMPKPVEDAQASTPIVGSTPISESVPNQVEPIVVGSVDNNVASVPSMPVADQGVSQTPAVVAPITPEPAVVQPVSQVASDEVKSEVEEI